jgi:hypothetical protein
VVDAEARGVGCWDCKAGEGYALGVELAEYNGIGDRMLRAAGDIPVEFLLSGMLRTPLARLAVGSGGAAMFEFDKNRSFVWTDPS